MPEITGSSPNDQIEKIKQAEVVEPVQVIELVSTAPEPICTSEVTQIEEEKYEELIPHMPTKKT